MISRRDALKTFGVAGLAVGNSGLQAEDPAIRGGDRPDSAAVLLAIADVVLPAEADRKAAVTAFTSWIDNYKEGADTDHGLRQHADPHAWTIAGAQLRGPDSRAERRRPRKGRS